MRQYISELMPLIVEALLDGAAATKREVAVSTLGQVVQSTGYVVSSAFDLIISLRSVFCLLFLLVPRKFMMGAYPNTFCATYVLFLSFGLRRAIYNFQTSIIFCW